MMCSFCCYSTTGSKMLTKKLLQKCTSGSNLRLPEEPRPTQTAGIPPPWPGPLHTQSGVWSWQTFKSPFKTPFKRGFPRGEGSSSNAGWKAPHLLQYDMIAIIGFCFHCVQNKTGFFLKVLYHLITNEHVDSCWPLLVDLADLARGNAEKLSNFFCQFHSCQFFEIDGMVHEERTI